VLPAPERIRTFPKPFRVNDDFLKSRLFKRDGFFILKTQAKTKGRRVSLEQRLIVKTEISLPLQKGTLVAGC
jgi:hypothetical protein